MELRSYVNSSKGHLEPLDTANQSVMKLDDGSPMKLQNASWHSLTQYDANAGTADADAGNAGENAGHLAGKHLYQSDN